jgi:hypothetical protein
MDKQSTKYVMTHGREKSRFTMTDRAGIEFRSGNVICDGKVYFIVSANGKIMECMEINP